MPGKVIRLPVPDGAHAIPPEISKKDPMPRRQTKPRRKTVNAIADPVGFARRNSTAKARKMQARRDNIVSQRDASRNDTRLMRFSFGGPPARPEDDKPAS